MPNRSDEAILVISRQNLFQLAKFSPTKLNDSSSMLPIINTTHVCNLWLVSDIMKDKISSM